MSKRAVSISYELFKEFITTGYTLELVECLKGIPEDAVLVDMFTDTFSITVVMVFESDNWEGEPSEYTVDSPVHGIVPCQEVIFRKAYHNKPQTKIVVVGGDRIRIDSKTGITVTFHKDNLLESEIEYNPFIDHNIDLSVWTEKEELT